MDYLCISALTISTQIGVHSWEQRIKQKLIIDITIPFDFSLCNETLVNTIDYDAVCNAITTYVESKSFKLIETVANEVAQLLKEQFNVSTLSVCVSKPHAIKNAGSVSVKIER